MKNIRKATADDIEPIKACARAAYKMFIERIGQEPAPMIADFAAQVRNGQVFVIDDKKTVVGYVVFYPRGDHLHLENVAVQPEYKGQRIGGQLIAFVEQQARQNGFKAVELYTNQKMIENLNMYPKLGYIETDRRNEDGFERVFFRKAV